VSAGTSTVRRTSPAEVPLVRSVLRLRARPLSFIEAMRDQGGVVLFRTGRWRAYLVNDPALVREMLVRQGHVFGKGGGLLNEAIASVLGNGLVTSVGSFHLRQRRLMQPAFREPRIARYAEIMQKVAAAKAASWRSGQLLDGEREMVELAFTIAARSLFSAEATGGMVAEIQQALPIVGDGVARRAYTPVAPLYRMPTPGNRRYRASLDRLNVLIDRIIADYRETAADHGDLLSMLLAARDDTGEPMGDQQLHDECLTMLLASSDTTARTLSWAFYTLSRRPDVEQRLYAEIDEVLGGRPVSHPDLARLEYLGRFVTETLRLYPPTWLLTRRVTADAELGGHRFPVGAHVFFSPYAVHRDPRYYRDPHRFDPDRWLPERDQARSRDCYLPFGLGARQCIGNSFAVTETAISVATIAGRWRLRPAPGRRVGLRVAVTHYPSPLPLITEPRRPGRWP
jgi:cytochrome P450